MTLEGIVRNGVIVPTNGAPLPEGTRVRIMVEPSAQDGQALQHFLLEQAGSIPGLPGDLAEQHDHYGRAGCFRDIGSDRPLNAKDKKALRRLLTREQFDALIDIASAGGPDVDAIARIRARSMT
jgi:hypothetical protein